LLAEQINPLQGMQGPASANIQIRDLAVIEADGQEIGAVRRAQAELLNGEQQLISLVGLLPLLTITGEAGDER
jgi:hypothetical protein